MTRQKHIVFVSPPLLGHTSQMLAIAAELVSHGHRVSFVINEIGKSWIAQTGAQFIAWNASIDSDRVPDSTNQLWKAASEVGNRWRGDRLMLERMIDVYEPGYQTIASILQAASPDLLVIDRAVFAAMDFAQQHQIPYIVQTRFLGNFVKLPADAPQFGTGYSKNMNFWQRSLNRLAPIALRFYLLPTLLKLNQVRKACAGDREVHDPFENQTTIVGSTFDLEIPRSLPDHVHLVGPIFAKTTPSLPEHLQTWLDAAQSGVIYIAFGTLATIQAWQAQALIEGLTQTGLQVLWSLPDSQQSQLPPLPDSVRIESFVPQFAVLSHPAIRVFVSHCGMNSILEALYWKTPILALPFFGDQHDNATRLMDAGVAQRLDKRRFSAAEVTTKATVLLHDLQIQESIDRISSNLRRAGGCDRAAEIVEAVLLNG
ncbi:glycosyltransferase, MGT family [Leptolyngbya sp. NIES-3755]|nr:glycosyltransferase, MGT family [Leptolyngbya sp. NIES-3755]